MLTIPIDAIITKDGFKVLRGKYWVYYKKIQCNNCNKQIFQATQNRLHSNGKSFCSKTCQSIYRHKNIDPKGAKIINHLNTPEFYYLIGLIASDGHITYPPNYVHYSVNVSLIDLELIEKIKNKFGGRIQINKRKNTKPIFQWKLNNIEFVEYLKSIGITHNKSLTLNVTNWFKLLIKSSQIYFIQGIFDGDGTICKNKQNLWRVGIVSGSYEFIKMLQQYINLGNIYKTKNCYSLQISNRNDIDLFLSIIYTNSTLHLNRKYQLYRQFKDEQNQRQIHKITRKCKTTISST